ncbi:hypothetical protein AURDEDRAFT_175829 [Auricularia subglabra TFB-10046 SS5]|uniref:Uncharacterized protein n=1 Tax=Auricularia subglabra (strain TFB-10046 / SS5) TaxID=717982 RepID=J0WSF8_AURST|nr:hypothetical protein AURDEDRAFT_175829 [Auricularia subglabra TFB-10046 SS5]
MSCASATWARAPVSPSDSDGRARAWSRRRDVACAGSLCAARRRPRHLLEKARSSAGAARESASIPEPLGAPVLAPPRMSGVQAPRRRSQDSERLVTAHAVEAASSTEQLSSPPAFLGRSLDD